MKFAEIRSALMVVGVLLFSVDGKSTGRIHSTIRIAKELPGRGIVSQNATRQTNIFPSPHAVCQTETIWSRPETAHDLYGNLVIVLPTFQQNNVLVEQIFHEKFCASAQTHENVGSLEGLLSTPGHENAHNKCFGVDEKLFHGVCITKPGFVYANVKNQRGEIGWNVIRIRGGCECALFERSNADASIRAYTATM